MSRTQVDDRGSVVVELLGLTLMVVTLHYLMMICARLVLADLRVTQAASAAARTASLARAPRTAETAANSTAWQAVTGARSACSRLSTRVDADDFRPGGIVRVRVACDVSLRDLTLLPVPGTRSVAASAASLIDQWRGSTP